MDDKGECAVEVKVQPVTLLLQHPSLDAIVPHVVRFGGLLDPL